MSKFIQDKKFPRIWVRKIRDDAMISMLDASILAKWFIKENESEEVNMAEIKIKNWKELDKKENNAFRLEYVYTISDADLGVMLKEGIQVFDKYAKAYPIIYISVEQLGKEPTIKLLQHFGFDIEFETSLTDKEKLNEIHTLVGKTRPIDDTDGVLQQIYDLTKD